MDAMGRIRAQDRALVRIVDQAMAEAALRSGAWLACRLGCTQCCMGTFAITQLDAMRLREGWKRLQASDPARAERLLERARQAAARYRPFYPGDVTQGVLSGDDAEEERFHERFGEDPCPALEPETGACSLYEWRPITCRTFGPAVRAADDVLGHCELCYHGATPDQIEACQVDFDPDAVEPVVLAELERATAAGGQTLVAFALERADQAA